MSAAGSLRVNLMLWLFGPVAVILAVSLWLSYVSATGQATAMMNRQILSSARMIAEETRFRDGAVAVIVPPAALELFATDSRDEVAYAVFDQNQGLIEGFPGLYLPTTLPADFDWLAVPARFRNEQMNAVVLRQSVITPDGTVPVIVMVGETLKGRDAMVRELWLRGFLEQAALVLAAALSIWIGITRELRPLLRLRRAVLDKPADKFDPFDADAVQSEIRPMVLALNDHMARLAAYLDRQRRFLDSAAHQMRTPLTVMRTQVGLALRSRDAAETTAVLSEINASLTAMSRLTGQLLTLGRVEHERAQLAVECIDLAGVARDVASHFAPLALDAGVDLAVEADEACQVAASAILVREAVVNLVENAVAHAGAAATATLTVTRMQGMGVLTLSDAGRGIAHADRARIFQRFQRGRAASLGGSGLGLTIVAEIAEMFGGRAELVDPPGGKGFAVRLSLPLVQGFTASTKTLV